MSVLSLFGGSVLSTASGTCADISPHIFCNTYQKARIGHRYATPLGVHCAVLLLRIDFNKLACQDPSACMSGESSHAGQQQVVADWMSGTWWVQVDVAGAVASFMLQDLRRFQMFDSSATRPYTVSAMACWKRASDLGYITLDASNKVAPPLLTPSHAPCTGSVGCKRTSHTRPFHAPCH